MKKSDKEPIILLLLLLLLFLFLFLFFININSCNSVVIISLISYFFLDVVDENIYLDGDHSRTISASHYEYRTKRWAMAAPEHTHIEMTFDKLDLDTCSYGSVDVRDGRRSDSKLIGRYCRHTTPTTVKSTGKYLWVEFNSKYGKGSFKATCRVKSGIHKLDNYSS